MGRGEPNPWDSLTDKVELLGFGVASICAAGALLALITDRLGGRWTWPLAGLALAPPVAIFSTLLSIAVIATCLLAGGAGAVWHFERLEMAGEEAQKARERPGLVAAFRNREQERQWTQSRVSGDRLAIGRARSGKVVTVPIGIAQGVRALISGAPGAGKTQALAAHGNAYISQGIAVGGIDPKSDPDARAAMEAAAEAMGVRFRAFSIDGPLAYNPLGRGSPSEVADKALAGELFTEPHYLRQAQRYLGLELQTMRAVGEWPPTLERVVENFDVDRLEALAGRADGKLSDLVGRYVQDMPARVRAELSGVRDRLAVLAESEYGRWLGEDGEQIDLLDSIRNGDVVYFGLDADRFPLASQMLATAIISDLVTLSAQLQGKDLRCLIWIDEFAAIAAEIVARLLARSRAANISVLLATHSFADFSVARPDSSDSLRRQLLSHLDYLIALRQSEPEAAELLSSIAGTRRSTQLTRHTRSKVGINTRGDEGSRRQTREFIVHPDRFKRLGVGEAIVIEPASKREAQVTDLWLPMELS